MSVTITIANNEAYVRKHHPERILVDVYPADEQSPEMKFERLPYEMNLANGNFSTVFSALGLDVDYCGHLDGRVLRDALRKTPLELLFRATVVDGNVTYCGIGQEQAAGYFTGLLEIAEEAVRREENVVWG